MPRPSKHQNKTFEELLELRYGKEGSHDRTAFEAKTQLFVIGEMLKEARKEAGMTQEALAEKIGTKKTYISRIENGKTDVQVSTLFRIFEEGLGLKVSINIEPRED